MAIGGRRLNPSNSGQDGSRETCVVMYVINFVCKASPSGLATKNSNVNSLNKCVRAFSISYIKAISSVCFFHPLTSSLTEACAVGPHLTLPLIPATWKHRIQGKVFNKNMEKIDPE